MNDRNAPAEVLRRAPRAPAHRIAPSAILRAGSAVANAPAPPSVAPRPPTTFRIERLVLDGPALGPLQLGQLRTALEQTLGDLLQNQPPRPASQSQDHLRGAPLRAASAGPAALGAAIARSLHAGLAGTGAPAE